MRALEEEASEGHQRLPGRVSLDLTP